jgi:hypothetical protein
LSVRRDPARTRLGRRTAPGTSGSLTP